MSPRTLYLTSALCMSLSVGCGASRQAPSALHAEAAEDEAGGSVDDHARRLAELDAELGNLLGRTPPTTVVETPAAQAAEAMEADADVSGEEEGPAGDAGGTPEPASPPRAAAAPPDAGTSGQRAAPPPSRCEAAEGLVARICELASRICGIAAGSGDADVVARCEDAKRSCERARAEYAAHCLR